MAAAHDTSLDLAAELFIEGAAGHRLDYLYLDGLAGSIRDTLLELRGDRPDDPMAVVDAIVDDADDWRPRIVAHRVLELKRLWVEADEATRAQYLPEAGEVAA